MKESHIAAMEEFIDNVKILINALGYKVLEPLLHPDSTDSTSIDDVLLYINKGNAVATGKVTSVPLTSTPQSPRAESFFTALTVREPAWLLSFYTLSMSPFIETDIFLFHVQLPA